MNIDIIYILIGICVILIILRFLIRPIMKIFKILFKIIIGGLIIYFVNFIGQSFDFHLGLNLITATIVGILGIPGLIIIISTKILIG